jgi:hypothetical protein
MNKAERTLAAVTLANHAKPLEELEELIREPPMTGPPDTPVARFLAYLLQVMNTLKFLIFALFEVLDNRLVVLEAQGTNVKATPAAAYVATTSKASSARPRIKCAKCHARGHSAEECKTANPTAVRHRVAQNAKTQAERRRMPPLLSALSAPTPSTSYHYPVANIPTDQAYFMAEAAELRRRVAQSSRDRRRARHAPVSSPP